MNWVNVTTSKPVDVGATESDALRVYLDELVHSWSLTLTKLGFTLVPLFFILDYFMMPSELLTRFAIYRLVATVAVIGQYFVIRATKPSRFSAFHGYFITIMLGGTIALMTTDLGGFNSTYYAGLLLVLTAVTILLPWSLRQSALNAALVVVMYIGFNLLFPSSEPVDTLSVANNMFFLMGTAIVAVSVSYVKQRLVTQEFHARSDLKKTRDALWGEMEVAKRIQTSLLPEVNRLGGFEVAATMRPAEEVGGDYYDLIRTQRNEDWVAIGDVSGHGVESGLIMMMTQTSIASVTNQGVNLSPAHALAHVNFVVKENIRRLGADRYMTLTLMRLESNRLVFAGKHQDILIYRSGTKTVEVVPTTGTWIGLVDDLGAFVSDSETPLNTGDVVLLFTDGVTEATEGAGEMFGQERLVQSLQSYALLPIQEIVNNTVRDVKDFSRSQDDDVTLLAIRKLQ